MILFLRHTQEFLDQAGERLIVLDQLAHNFTSTDERLKTDSMNEVLMVLTVATVIMLPSQFLAGVFGMNFEQGMTMLKSENGYMIFWLLCATSVVVLIVGGFIASQCRRRPWQVSHGQEGIAASSQQMRRLRCPCCCCCRNVASKTIPA